jgi:hypothetical protein
MCEMAKNKLFLSCKKFKKSAFGQFELNIRGISLMIIPWENQQKVNSSRLPVIANYSP